MSSCFYKNGLSFECTRCGYCCGHEPGYVFLSNQDIQNFLSFFSLSQDEFLKKYCRMVHVGFFKRISLLEKSNYDCIFWEEGRGCTVYNARPLQCRTYPFWDAVVDSKAAWELEAQSCPGMNHGRSFSRKEIDAYLKQREEQPPVDVDG